jgi:tripartite-type tricarboxylate transporter receptor subunit TctC
VVPLAPGSSTDLFARLIAAAMSQSLGQPVVVENKPGADGAIGATEVARAAPDGYTLMLATNGSMSAVPAMRKVPPYDPVKDFTAISLVGNYTMFLFVSDATPANSLQQLLEHIRANPGKLNYAAGSTGGVIATEQMLTHGGNLSMVRIPYKGEPPAITDLASDRVQMMFGTMTTADAFVKQGRLRVLATTQKRRSAMAPNIPTMVEAGLPQFSFYGGWCGVFGPAQLPKEITARINQEVNAALARPDIREQLERQFFFAQGSTSEELSAYTREQLDVYARAYRALGIERE